MTKNSAPQTFSNRLSSQSGSRNCWTWSGVSRDSAGPKAAVRVRAHEADTMVSVRLPRNSAPWFRFGGRYWLMAVNRENESNREASSKLNNCPWLVLLVQRARELNLDPH